MCGIDIFSDEFPDFNYAKGELFFNYYKLRDFVSVKKDTEYLLLLNNCEYYKPSDFCGYDHFVVNGNDSICFDQFNNPVKDFIVSTIVIDSDYDKKDFYLSIRNVGIHDLYLSSCNASIFRVSVDKDKPIEKTVYETPVMKFYEEEKEIFDQVVEFKQGTTGANALDIVFFNNYTMQPKGSLSIRLPLIKSYHSKPFTFVLRSRFARTGVRIHSVTSLDKQAEGVEILLVNNGTYVQRLENNFLSLYLEEILAANLPLETIPVIATNFNMDRSKFHVPVKMRYKYRKSKSILIEKKN